MRRTLSVDHLQDPAGGYFVMVQDISDLFRRFRETDDEEWRRSVHDLKNVLFPVSAYLDLLCENPGALDSAILGAAREAVQNCVALAREKAVAVVQPPSSIAEVVAHISERTACAWPLTAT